MIMRMTAATGAIPAPQYTEEEFTRKILGYDYAKSYSEGPGHLTLHIGLNLFIEFANSDQFGRSDELSQKEALVWITANLSPTTRVNWFGVLTTVGALVLDPWLGTH